ncbi:MAG: hypothetical protein IKO40_00085, partial [Kiritimatiellae bacterium]|nr:hypothetical protein [Kiritimatiellia bacterium]
MKTSFILRPLSFVLAATISATIAAETPKFNWRLPKCARIEGDILIVDVPESDPHKGVETNAHCEADVNLSPFLADGRGA